MNRFKARLGTRGTGRSRSKVTFGCFDADSETRFHVLARTLMRSESAGRFEDLRDAIEPIASADFLGMD